MARFQNQQNLQYFLTYQSFSSFEPDILLLCVCYTTPTQKLFCLHVFRQAGPSQRIDCWASRSFSRTQRRATTSGFQSRFRNLWITSPALYQLSHVAATCRQVNKSNKVRITEETSKD